MSKYWIMPLGLALLFSASTIASPYTDAKQRVAQEKAKYIASFQPVDYGTGDDPKQYTPSKVNDTIESYEIDQKPPAKKQTGNGASSGGSGSTNIWGF